jgi:4a-hydroxytetrahydrobiopterin dehydratase
VKLLPDSAFMSLQTKETVLMAEALSDAQVQDVLGSLSGWERDGDSLTKTYKFDAYLAGVAFAAAVGTVCEGMDHHPDLFIGWRKVSVTFTTHDAGSKITQKDVDAAKACEALGYPKA